MKHVVLFIRQAREDELDAISAVLPSARPHRDRRRSSKRWPTSRARRSSGCATCSSASAPPAAATPTSCGTRRIPAVRRTAVELLRAFGGAEALPDLKALLVDAEPAIQRDALRAIMQIGTDEAYAALGDALRDERRRRRATRFMQVHHVDRATSARRRSSSTS